MNIPKKTIYIPKTVYSDSVISEWEKEFRVPDDMPNISKLIRIDSTPSIESTHMNGKITEIKGVNNCNILYESEDDGKICPLSFSEPFFVEIDTKSDSSALMPFAKVFCTFVSCKVLSPGKLMIKSKNRISLDAKETLSVEIPNTEMGDNVLFYNTTPFNTQEFLPPITKSFDLEEELTLDGAYPPIDNIIFSTVKLIPIDMIKNIGSATLNTSALFKVFYESEGNYVMFTRSVPVSLTVTDDDINENTLIYYFLTVSNQRSEKNIDNYGENRIIKISYSPVLTLFRVKESTEDVPTDVFSPNNILECDFEKISYEELTGIISRPFTVEKIFELPNTEITEIIDTSAVMDVESFENTDQGDKLEGICGISVLGKSQNGIDCAVFNVNFTEIFPEIENGKRCECSVTPIQVNGMMTGRDIITVRVSATATIRQYELKEKTVVSNFKAKSEREARDKSCITLYYPNSTETLWSISKEYGIDPEEIMKENPSLFSAEGNVVKSTKAIFIP